MIVEAWESPSWDSAAFSLMKKLKNTKVALNDLNINHFENIHFKIKAILVELDKTQKFNPSPVSFAKEESL